MSWSGTIPHWLILLLSPTGRDTSDTLTKALRNGCVSIMKLKIVYFVLPWRRAYWLRWSSVLLWMLYFQYPNWYLPSHCRALCGVPDLKESAWKFLHHSPPPSVDVTLEIELLLVSFALQTEFHVCCLYNFHFFSFTAGISLEIFGAVQTHRAKEVKKSQSVDWQ